MEVRPGSGVVLLRRDKGLLVALYAAILATTGLAFALLFYFSARYTSPNLAATGSTFAGIGFIVYVFGLRHGLDADHIAAIDNTTRKLLQEKTRPLTVGTWFSLGHSTIVVGLIVALVVAAKAVTSQIPTLRTAGALVGTSVSGVFLFLIGLVNLIIVLEVYRIFRGIREGRFNEQQLDDQLRNRGFLNRYFGKLFRVVTRPRQIYPIGVLFGLGFDTATEVVLIVIAVSLGLTLPIYAILVLPLLFTCGMVLVDTSDCLAMSVAYGWAFLKPMRKIYYNLTVTIISVLVAFVIGGIEVLQVLTLELHLTGGAWGALATIDPATLGALVVAVFVGTWLVATGYYRYKRLDDVPFPGHPVAPAGPTG
ncbi:MAG: HoxN/HupN/NixA family nickel/cobalt transporter [Thermoplasmata archaeon]|nr:HoxN/HupN/NixA family nickel/cobalt transporter [Thermoplasmata archaeon]